MREIRSVLCVVLLLFALCPRWGFADWHEKPDSRWEETETHEDGSVWKLTYCKEVWYISGGGTVGITAFVWRDRAGRENTFSGLEGFADTGWATGYSADDAYAAKGGSGRVSYSQWEQSLPSVIRSDTDRDGWYTSISLSNLKKQQPDLFQVVKSAFDAIDDEIDRYRGQIKERLVSKDRIKDADCRHPKWVPDEGGASRCHCADCAANGVTISAPCEPWYVPGNCAECVRCGEPLFGLQYHAGWGNWTADKSTGASGGGYSTEKGGDGFFKCVCQCGLWVLDHFDEFTGVYSHGNTDVLGDRPPCRRHLKCGRAAYFGQEEILNYPLKIEKDWIPRLDRSQPGTPVTVRDIDGCGFTYHESCGHRPLTTDRSEPGDGGVWYEADTESPDMVCVARYVCNHGAETFADGSASGCGLDVKEPVPDHAFGDAFASAKDADGNESEVSHYFYHECANCGRKSFLFASAAADGTDRWSWRSAPHSRNPKTKRVVSEDADESGHWYYEQCRIDGDEDNRWSCGKEFRVDMEPHDDMVVAVEEIPGDDQCHRETHRCRTSGCGFSWEEAVGHAYVALDSYEDQDENVHLRYRECKTPGCGHRMSCETASHNFDWELLGWMSDEDVAAEGFDPEKVHVAKRRCVCGRERISDAFPHAKEYLDFTFDWIDSATHGHSWICSDCGYEGIDEEPHTFAGISGLDEFEFENVDDPDTAEGDDIFHTAYQLCDDCGGRMSSAVVPHADDGDLGTEDLDGTEHQVRKWCGECRSNWHYRQTHFYSEDSWDYEFIDDSAHLKWRVCNECGHRDGETSERHRDSDGYVVVSVSDKDESEHTCHAFCLRCGNTFRFDEGHLVGNAFFGASDENYHYYSNKCERAHITFDSDKIDCGRTYLVKREAHSRKYKTKAEGGYERKDESKHYHLWVCRDDNCAYEGRTEESHSTSGQSVRYENLDRADPANGQDLSHTSYRECANCGERIHGATGAHAMTSRYDVYAENKRELGHMRKYWCSECASDWFALEAHDYEPDETSVLVYVDGVNHRRRKVCRVCGHQSDSDWETATHLSSGNWTPQRAVPIDTVRHLRYGRCNACSHDFSFTEPHALGSAFIAAWTDDAHTYSNRCDCSFTAFVRNESHTKEYVDASAGGVRIKSPERASSHERKWKCRSAGCDAEGWKDETHRLGAMLYKNKDKPDTGEQDLNHTRYKICDDCNQEVEDGVERHVKSSVALRGAWIDLDKHGLSAHCNKCGSEWYFHEGHTPESTPKRWRKDNTHHYKKSVCSKCYGDASATEEETHTDGGILSVRTKDDTRHVVTHECGLCSGIWTEEKNHSKTVGTWEYLDVSVHRKTVKCSACDWKDESAVASHKWKEDGIERTSDTYHIKRFVCTVCGGSKSESQSHTYARNEHGIIIEKYWSLGANRHRCYATCTECGRFAVVMDEGHTFGGVTAYVYENEDEHSDIRSCGLCGYTGTYSMESHDWGGSVFISLDDDEHFYVRTCGKCNGSASGREVHGWGKFDYEDLDDYHTFRRRCDDCGHEDGGVYEEGHSVDRESSVVECYTDNGDGTHTHSPGMILKFCLCGHDMGMASPGSTIEAHSFNEEGKCVCGVKGGSVNGGDPGDMDGPFDGPFAGN